MTSATSQDVAKRAGVSIATVSRVLNDLPHVRPVVRRKVLRAIKDLDYQPNRTAQRLRAKQTKMIGLVITDIQNPFFTTLVRAVEDVVNEHQYTVLLYNSDEDEQKEQVYIDILSRERVAGAIIMPTGRQSYNPLSSLRAPIVIVDRTIPDLVTDSVVLDNVAGAYLAITHLIELGHRRIGLIGAPTNVSVGRERRAGYEKALREHGLAVDETLIRTGNFKEDGGFQAACELLDLIPRPTAFLAVNNLMTMGALKAIREKGLQIPDDISLIGFDDLPWWPYLAPPLTAVRQPTYQLGAEAARMLFARLLDREGPVQRRVLEPELIVRGSTAPPCA